MYIFFFFPFIFFLYNIIEIVIKRVLQIKLVTPTPNFTPVLSSPISSLDLLVVVETVKLRADCSGWELG